MSHGGRQVTGHVVHVDRFGNLVSDIPADTCRSLSIALARVAPGRRRSATAPARHQVRGRAGARGHGEDVVGDRRPVQAAHVGDDDAR
jgi:hypothetical protein